jgi:hypothetical protein
VPEFSEARGTLARAVTVEGAARQQSGWYARYLWAYATGQLVIVPMAVLWHGTVAVLTYTLLVAALVAGISVYAARQRVVRRGFGRKHGTVIGTWAAAYGCAIALGTTVFAGDVAFAAAAAVGCALPPAVGAWLEDRQSA